MKENALHFTVNAKQLDWALRNVKLHASTDATLPGITQIRIRVDGDVRVDATDRYTVGEARIPREDEDFGTTGTFFINASSLAVILPTLKAIHHGDVHVGAEEDHVEFGSTSVDIPDAEFPAIDKLWNKQLPDDAEPFGITSTLAKKLAGYKPSDRHDNRYAWQVYAGATGKPMILIRNESFRVLAIGTRIVDREHAEGTYSTW